MISFNEKDRKIIGWITILSGVLAAGCIIAGLIGANYNVDAFSDPFRLADTPGVKQEWARWSMLFDMLGYYLLLLPVIFYLHNILERKTPWANFITSLGFGYVLIGSIGAAILAAVWPSLISEFDVTSTSKSDFALITSVVVKGLWNQLEVFFSGVWWIMTGVIAINHRALKITTITLGISCVIDSIGELMQWKFVAETGLTIYLVLAIVWAIWLGILLIRKNI
jgi:hypothetical protein